MHFYPFPVCVWVGEGREKGWKGRGKISGDIQADIGSMERPWREGGCMFMLVFCFAVGGEVPALPSQGFGGWV